MNITLIRHLPTEWNRKERLQGRRDIDISPVTEEWAQRISANQLRLLKLPPVDLVLASTLKRTQQTAALYGLEPEIDELLDELDFGPFEGQPKQKLMEQHGEQWLHHPTELALGESLQNLEKRIYFFLDKYKGFDHILVFGHGSWIRAMVSIWQQGDLNGMNKFSLDNNQCLSLTIEQKGRDKLVRDVNV